MNRLQSILFFLCNTLLLSSCTPEREVIYIDNYSGKDISIILNGKDWAQLKDNTSIIRGMEVGSHNIILSDLNNGQEIERMEVSIIKSKKHVLNLLGAAKYLRDTSAVVEKGVVIEKSHRTSVGEIITDKFFVADVDYVMNDLPDNADLMTRNKAHQKSYLQRLTKKSSQIATHNLSQKQVSEKKTGLSAENRNKIYDIIRTDKACESIKVLSNLLAIDADKLTAECSKSYLEDDQKLEDWFVAKNRINYIISSSIPSKPLSEAIKQSLQTYVNKNDLEGYFEALEKINPQDNNLVGFQCRYNRIRNTEISTKKEIDNIHIMENRLRLSIGFKTKPAKYLR